MRPRRAIHAIAPLLKQPSFTSSDAMALGVSAATLTHYRNAGSLQRIGRGIYRSNTELIINDFRWEDLVLAIQRVKSGVVCLTSALALYELTDEIPRRHWIAIRNNSRHRADDTVKVIRMRNIELGRTTMKLGGVTIPIFDRERTIIDAFRYLGIETAIKSLQMSLTQRGRNRIDPEKLRKYAKQLRTNIEPYLLALTI